MAKKDSSSKTVIAKNKKAYFDYEILETLEAGIVLTGAEVKAIRLAKINLKGSFIVEKGGKIFVENLHIGAYQPKNQPAYNPTKRRVLLLHKKEIRKTLLHLEEKGITMIPLEVYFKGKYVKMLLGAGRGKKKYDKRETIKKRDAEREIRRRVR